MKKQSSKPSKASKPSKSNRYVIIMAGGKGERFWPVSREATPKQLIRLLGKESFLQQAVNRVLPLVPLENILIITNAAQAAAVRKQLPKLPKDNVVAEPVGRDTCAAVALGAAIVGARSSNAVMAVLPADHVIPEEAKFQQVLADSMDIAGECPVIVTIGINPSGPETGYGYIRHESTALSGPPGSKTYATRFFRAEQFVEKPPLEKAIEYVASGKYRWNAGMFIWSVGTVTKGLEQHTPEMHAACLRWMAAAAKGKLTALLKREYPTIQKISIDFALMEKARNVVVADGSFEWDDLGAWPALARHVKQDAEGNAAVADFVHVDASNNIVFDARSKARRTPICLVGLQDTVVVQTDDATMIVNKAKSQKVKDLVRKLAEQKHYKRLV